MVNKGRQGKQKSRGESRRNAKLTESDVIKIRALRKYGNTLQSIANLFGVSNPTVHLICARKKWAHIP
jgi:DNA invertase Pin-like site-specific DNA recombinase